MCSSDLGELGFGVRAPEGGQSGLRDDATTGSRQLRSTLEHHLRPVDVPPARRGPRGAIGRMIQKAERFAPGAGRKYRIKSDSDYSAALIAGNSERDSEPMPSADDGGASANAPATAATSDEGAG